MVLERSQTVSNGLKRSQSATKPSALAHLRVSQGFELLRKRRRRAHPRVSSSFEVQRNPGRRVHPRVSVVFKVPRNPGRRAHTRVSNGHTVPRNPRRRSHPRVSSGLHVPLRQSARGNLCRKSRECMLTTLGTVSRHGWGWGRAVTGHTTFRVQTRNTTTNT